MICKIADLVVDVPDLGNMKQRCLPYLCSGNADFVIQPRECADDMFPQVSAEENFYLTTGFSFYEHLLQYDGMMLHASAVAVEGKAYLFSGPCGMGKSTHARKYLESFPSAYIINDDKPALRRIDGQWQVYGTPWCGKDGIKVNTSVPLGGICFLLRGDRAIRRLTPAQSVANFLTQTTFRENMEIGKSLMTQLSRLIGEIPIFEFTNHAEPGDEQITYGAFLSADQERKSEY